jgi:Flp pilus assembly protein TadG
MDRVDNMKNRHNTLHCKGVSTLEMVFVIIILLTLFLGMAGFSYAFLIAQKTTNAARHGARTGVRYAATAADAINAVHYAMGGSSYTDPLVSYDGDPNVVGTPVIVTVTAIEIDFLNMGTPGIIRIPVPDNFTATVVMAKEGP